jgi:polyhydroxyalkanoate synthesis regulator phasin
MGGGTLNFIPLWTTPDGCTLGNSLMSQLTAGRVDVNGNFNLLSTAGAYQIGASTVLSILGTNNLFAGVGAGSSNTGAQNTFVGANAGNRNVGGNYNTFIGEEAGWLKNQGDHNAFTGYRAGYRNFNGKFNAFFGSEAGHYNNGSNNVFVGYGANYGPLAYAGNTGDNNTMVGFEAGRYNTANNNSFYGYRSGFSNTQGFSNTFSGFQAGQSNTTGAGNTFIGTLAGYHNSESPDNTFVGSGSGSGEQSTCSAGNACSRQNTCIGDYSCASGNLGAFNTVIGFGAGADGDANIFIGDSAGEFNLSAFEDIYIGNQGAYMETNTIRVGREGNQVDTYIAGIYSASSESPSQTVCVASDGKLFGTTGTCPSSSRRFKEAILDMGDSSSKLFQLRPVTFFYKPQYDDGSRLLQYGLIAEEVAKVYPEMVAYGRDGQPYTVKYQSLAPMLLNELQKQHTVVAAQQDAIKTQQEQVNAQQQQMQAQQQQIEQLQQRLSRLESLVAKK